jgi:Putative zinc-finger
MDMDGRAQNRTAPPGHVDLEDLAALIDGRLPAGDCSRVRAHLAECGDCYEIFADVVRFKEAEGEEEEGSGHGKVKPFPFVEAKKALPRSWLTAAAAAALVLAGSFLVYRPLTTPVVKMDEMVASVAPRVEPGQIGTEARYRGELAEIEQPLFRLGARFMDLQVALALNYRAQAIDLVQVIPGLVDKIPFVEPSAKEFFVAAEQRLERGESPRALQADVVEVQALLREADPLTFDLGAWVEAARLAAISQNETFFDSRKNRRLLTWFARHQELDDGVREILDEMQVPWKKKHFDQIEKGLSKLNLLYNYEERE